MQAKKEAEAKAAEEKKSEDDKKEDNSLGFESLVGKDQFLTPLAWDVTDFEIKAASEHTINDKRFDLELQIFHKPRAVVAKDGEEAKVEGAGAKRRLQAAGEKVEETDAEKAEKAKQHDIKKNKTNDYKYAAVSILFSVADSTAGSSDLFDGFFTNL